jgi:hypothetical protein
VEKPLRQKLAVMALAGHMSVVLSPPCLCLRQNLNVAPGLRPHGSVFMLLDNEVARAMVWECLQNARECEEKAHAIDKEDIRAFYQTLAEHWRTLAQIAAENSSK